MRRPRRPTRSTCRDATAQWRDLMVDGERPWQFVITGKTSAEIEQFFGLRELRAREVNIQRSGTPAIPALYAARPGHEITLLQIVEVVDGMDVLAMEKAATRAAASSRQALPSRSPPSVRSGVAVRPRRNFGVKWSMSRR